MFLGRYAVDPEVEPVAEGWLGVFFASAAREDLERWTSTVASELEQRGTVDAERTWSAWLREWVERRLAAGYPAVSGKELTDFYRIVLALPASALPAALQLLRGRPIPPSDVYYEVHRTEERLDDLAPDDLADLLLLILQQQQGYILLQKEDAVRDKLAQATRDKVEALRSLFVRLQRLDLAERILPPAEPLPATEPDLERR